MSAWTPDPGPGDPEGFYAAIGVLPSATAGEIRKAYRKQASKWHPDRCNDPAAEERIRWINLSREVLTDDRRRCEYDRQGAEWFKITADVSRIDFGRIRLGKSRTSTCRIRGWGASDRLGDVALPRPASDWWVVELAVVDDETDPDAWYDLAVTASPNATGRFDDVLEVVVGGRLLTIELSATAAISPVGSLGRKLAVAGRGHHWECARWSREFRKFCIAGFIGLIPIGLVAHSTLEDLSLQGELSALQHVLFRLLFYVVAAAAVMTAVSTRGFKHGTIRTRIAAITLGGPGIVAFATIAAALAVITFLVVAAGWILKEMLSDE